MAYVHVDSRRFASLLPATVDATAVVAALPQRPNAPSSNDPAPVVAVSARVASKVELRKPPTGEGCGTGTDGAIASIWVAANIAGGASTVSVCARSSTRATMP